MLIRWVPFLILMSFSACSATIPTNQPKFDQCLFAPLKSSEAQTAQSPDDIEHLLNETPRWSGPPITMHFDSVPVRVALEKTLPLTGCSWVINAEVGNCSVTADFRLLPLEQVIDAMLWQCSLDKYIENRLIRVATVDQLRQQREMLRQLAATKKRSGRKALR